ncbi:MAG: hypothetical protein ACXW1D_00100 [Halobacteriota archaeon]
MVTRYNPTTNMDGWDVSDVWAEMEESKYGEYVSLSDYQSLEADYDDLKSRIYDLYRSV